MSWNTFNTQIYNLIDTNKATIGNNGLQELYSYPTMSFLGFPSLTITPSSNTNDYETTSENERIYAFTIRTFYDTKDIGLEDALSALRKSQDDLMDLFDQESMKQTGQTIGQSMPTNYTFINIFAVPSVWGQTADENLVFAELDLRIRVSVDVT